MPDFLEEAQQLFPYTQSLRRDFHRHPELGFEETRTAGIVASELKSLGLEVSTGIAETGVIALLESERPGPVVLLRFDMDALPLEEQTGAEYASQNPGVMHACGHDGHTAIGLTVARLLHAHRSELVGTLKFVFQPAEEGLGGAERMVKEGVLENPRPDYSLGLHLWNDFPIGLISATMGPVMAASQTFRIVIKGKGAHAAAPHQSVDPLIATAHVVSALQTIVSRNVDPLESVVISVTSMHAGTAFNVIPSQAEICGTIRSFKPIIREFVLKHFFQLVDGITASMGCDAEIEIQNCAPVLVNDQTVTQRVQGQVRALFPEGTLKTDSRTMGSEDMSYLMDDIPGCYIFVGSSNPRKGLGYGHHHPKFDFDEDAMPHAAAVMAASAADLLGL